MDARISSSSIKTFGQCDSSILKKVCLVVLPHCPITVERERVLVVLPPVRSQGLSFRRSESRRMDTARSCHNNTQYRSVKYQLPIILPGRAFFIYSNFATFLSLDLEVPKKCFAGVFPNRSLTTSLKITLLLSGMHFVKFSTYVDGFLLVVMFIIWSGTLLKSNPYWH